MKTGVEAYKEVDALVRLDKLIEACRRVIHAFELLGISKGVSATMMLRQECERAMLNLKETLEDIT